MEELKDVILHVYDLTAPGNAGPGASLFSRLLPSLGLGAYHTSIEVDGYRYSFAANAGIIKSTSRSEGVPNGAKLKESIFLGSSGMKNRGELNSVLKILGEKFFTPIAYHLVHRNCNHFSETLATAMILSEKLFEANVCRLKAYPMWINRLANSSKGLVSHDIDIVPCNVIDEARKAVGCDQKLGWGLTSGKEDKQSQRSTQHEKKKLLTEAQKAALAKVRKK